MLAIAACGGAEGRHSRSVDSNELSAANYQCGWNAVRTDEVTSQGDPLRYWLPCWDLAKSGVRYEVRANPAIAAELAKAESTQCVGLFPAALERSPFAQANAIGEIVPRRSGTTISGAHIVFKPVPGLTVSWMRRAIACHQVRWHTLGMPHDYLTGDPTLVEGAKVEVSVSDHRIVVSIETESPAAAQVVLARAYRLLDGSDEVSTAAP
jgi:hypothetical protein